MSNSAAENRAPLLSKRYELLGHISLGVRSYTKSKDFYNAVLSTLGGVCVYDNPEWRILGYGPGYDRDLEPFTLFENKEMTSVSEGFHFAFNAPDRKSVRQFWEVAMEHGGNDEGKWGLRKECGDFYYAAFVRDPDGNKLEAVFQEEDEECGKDDNHAHEIMLRRKIVKNWVSSNCSFCV